MHDPERDEEKKASAEKLGTTETERRRKPRHYTKAENKQNTRTVSVATLRFARQRPLGGRLGLGSVHLDRSHPILVSCPAHFLYCCMQSFVGLRVPEMSVVLVPWAYSEHSELRLS